MPQLKFNHDGKECLSGMLSEYRNKTNISITTSVLYLLNFICTNKVSIIVILIVRRRILDYVNFRKEVIYI